MKPFLQVKNISKVFPGVNALKDVSIDFHSGEVHALLGENGAGKSTLIKIISGVYFPTHGQVFLESNPVDFKTPRQALDAGISVIHQELSIANDLTVAENIFLGEEPKLKGNFLDRKRMNQEAQNVLDEMGVAINATAIARHLSAAEQQMIEIAKVVKRNSKVVIMDEPTSSLSEHEIEALFKQIKILRDKNVAIIYISHRIAELFAMCDKVTVLKDGETVKTFNVGEITEKELVKNMVGREMKDYYNRKKHTRGEETLRVEHLSKEGQFEDISFNAYAGEILGFAGLIGSGRTEVMETIFGARHQDAGQVFVNGELTQFSSSAQAIDCGLGMVTEDRRRTGLLLDASVLKNMVLPSLVNHKKRGGFINFPWEKEVCFDYIKKLGIKTPDEKTIIKSLSGGNQQKVILAKWLIAQTKILILDEPTRGIDVKAKSEFYALMNEFVAQGGTIVMVSSELPEILGISDRILVMSEGRLAGELSYHEATEEKVMELASLNV